MPHHTLLYQLLHMRLAVDEFATLLYPLQQQAAEAVDGEADAAAPAAAGGVGVDLMALLGGKQRVRGRDRRVVLPVLAPGPER